LHLTKCMILQSHENEYLNHYKPSSLHGGGEEDE